MYSTEYYAIIQGVYWFFLVTFVHNIAAKDDMKFTAAEGRCVPETAAKDDMKATAAKVDLLKVQ